MAAHVVIGAPALWGRTERGRGEHVNVVGHYSVVQVSEVHAELGHFKRGRLAEAEIASNPPHVHPGTNRFLLKHVDFSTLVAEAHFVQKIRRVTAESGRGEAGLCRLQWATYSQDPELCESRGVQAPKESSAVLDRAGGSIEGHDGLWGVDLPYGNQVRKKPNIGESRVQADVNVSRHWPCKPGLTRHICFSPAHNCTHFNSCTGLQDQ